MAARIRGPCTVNWPSIASKFKDCPICGEETDWTSSKSPDFTEAEAFEYAAEVKALLEAGKGKPTPEHADRVARYLKMQDSARAGFSELDAERLAVAKWSEQDSLGRVWVRPLDPTRVARALASGCSCATAVDIFT